MSGGWPGRLFGSFAGTASVSEGRAGRGLGALREQRAVGAPAGREALGEALTEALGSELAEKTP